MDKFENAFDIAPDEKGKKPGKKKKVHVINIILYSIAAILITIGAIMLVNEFWLRTKDETQGLISEDEYAIYPEIETYTPLATPIDDYDLIPVKFHFIDRSASCDIVAVGLNEDNKMDSIPRADAVAWLSTSPYVTPGDRGNAVLGGHNLWKGEAGIFSLLKKMSLGEKVAVTFDKGFTRYFEVVKKYECSYNDTTPMNTEDLDEPLLTLITCAGDWSGTLGQSKHRIVVVCKPVKKG